MGRESESHGTVRVELVFLTSSAGFRRPRWLDVCLNAVSLNKGNPETWKNPSYVFGLLGVKHKFEAESLTMMKALYRQSWA
jgi:hypothetical protein